MNRKTLLDVRQTILTQLSKARNTQEEHARKMRGAEREIERYSDQLDAINAELRTLPPDPIEEDEEDAIPEPIEKKRRWVPLRS